MADRAQWVALPRKIDLNAKTIRLDVFVSPRLDTANTLPRPWDAWPARVKQPDVKFHVSFDGDPTGIPAMLDTAAITGEAMWCRFLEHSHPCQGGTATATTLTAASKGGLVVTSNRAGNVAEAVQEHKTALFERQAMSLAAHKIAMTIESHRAIDVTVEEARARLGFLSFRRDPPRNVTTTNGGNIVLQDFDVVSAFDRWLHNLDEPFRTVVERYLYRLSSNPYEELEPDTLSAFAEIIHRRFDISRPEIPPAQDQQALPFLEMLLFHRRASHTARMPTASRSAITALAHQCNEFDFHQRIAALANRPAIMRGLGLILSLTATYTGARPPLKQSGGTVRVIPPDLGFENEKPQTQYAFGPGLGGKIRFSARGSDELVEGFLGVGPDTPYCLHSLDADVAAFQLVQSVSEGAESPAATAYEVHAKPDPTARYAIPADRSTGIALVHCKRDKHVESKIRAMASTLMKGILTADDITSGYIVEVRSSLTGDNWYSLCARTEEYLYGPVGEAKNCLKYFNGGTREAVIRLVPTKPTDQTEAQNKKDASELPDELNITEAVFRWDGWSLGAPRLYSPNAIRDSGDGAVDDRPMPWQLISRYRPLDKALVPLRFGARYWFRVKAADLAGEPIEDCDRCDDSVVIGGDTADKGFPYLRYDPVPHPVVLLSYALDTKKNPGETLRRLVLHTRAHGLEREAVERCLIPPPATFRIAEQHGMFDALNPDESSGFDDIRLLPHTDGNRVDSWRLPSAGGDDASNTDDPICQRPGKEKHGPYWPDPMAQSLCVRVEDLVTREMFEIPATSFYERRQWPRARKIILRLYARTDGTARIRWDWYSGPRTLVIALPPSWVARVTISSGLPQSQAHCMAHQHHWDAKVQQQIEEHKAHLNFDEAAALEKTQAVVRDGIICGCHPMISPCEELTLVHPVKRPLRPPVITNTFVDRKPNETTATLGFDVEIDRKSSGHVDIESKWDEIIDDPTKPKSTTSEAHAHVMDRIVASPEDAKDYDPYRMPVVRVGAGDVEIVAGKTPTGLQQFNDTKHRVVRYRAVATSRFRSDYPSALPIDDFTVDSEETPVSIPSSARPKPPEVVYVMPTFGWSRQNEDFDLEPTGRFHSRRRGGGLRVYLARPWFSSGAGELLGIVLWPGMSEAQCDALNEARPASFHPGSGFTDAEQPLSRYITRWGADPIHEAPSSMPFLPTPNHFHSPHEPIRFGCSLTLDECAKIEGCGQTDRQASVAGYRPQFDHERKLWYCDVTVRPIPTYYTFIRLALVRYQPNSLRDAEISRVVRAEFAQLVPDRAVSVTRVVDRKRSVWVQVFGTPGVDRRLSNNFEVTVFRQCASLDHTKLSWTPDSTIRTTPAPAAGDALWSVRIEFPDACDRYRIVVCEFERHAADAHGEKGREIENTREAKRLVYADVIEF